MIAHMSYQLNLNILQNVVRDVCSSVNDQFLHLVAKEEERQRQEEEAAAHTQTPVKTKMLRRLSKAAAEQAAATEKEAQGKKKGEKKVGMLLLKKRRGTEQAGEGGRRMKREKTRSTVEERADKDFVLIPLDTSGLSGTSHGAGTSGGGGGLAEEIGKQFMAVTKTPTNTGGRRPGGGRKLRGPKVKRLNTTEVGSLSKRARNEVDVDESMESLDGSTGELLPPLVVRQSPARHDGNVVTQDLEKTDGVRIPDLLDYLSATPSRTRLTLGPDSFPPSNSGSDPALELMQISQPSQLEPAPPSSSAAPSSLPQFLPPPPPPQPASSPQTPPPPPAVGSLLSQGPSPPLPPSPLTSSSTPPQPERAGKGEQNGGPETEGTEECLELSESRESGDNTKRKSRTSMRLETMEEGEVETR